MGFQLEWDIEGEKQLSRKLQIDASAIKDFRKPFTTAANSLKKIFEQDVFQTQGAVIGEKWARLSPYTVAQKARLGFPLQPLVRTGFMRGAFKTAVSSDQAVIYNDAEYFKYHQSNRPRTRLPRRVMMKLGLNQREMVVKVFHEFIRSQLNKHV